MAHFTKTPFVTQIVSTLRDRLWRPAPGPVISPPPTGKRPPRPVPMAENRSLRRAA